MRRLAAALVLPVLACSPGGGGWEGAESLSPLPADRREYAAFRAGRPEIREPNYLPFLLHRVHVPGSEDDLLFTCRWPVEAFPLRVSIEPPAIAEGLDESPKPTAPGEYVAAVRRALEHWERELGAPVEFRVVEAGAPSDVRIRLVGEKAPTPEDGKLVLGMTPLGDACRVAGGDPDGGRIEATLHDVEARIYVADDFGLLTPDQVETVAAHEMGHALGGRSHSPLPADLMHEIARDRLGARRLSPSDANSFAALYALPSGTVYARRAGGRPAPPSMAKPPEGPPKLADAAYDAGAAGFRIRLPAGWSVIPVERGVAAVDGLAWDYDASLQVLSVPVGSIREYLDRYGEAHLEKGPLLGRRDLEIDGRPAARLAVVVQEAETVEEVTLVETGQGRLVLAISEVPAESFDAYAPWLHEALGSLRLGEAQAPPRAKAATP